ncbi:MAG: hypothetical protein ACRDG4_09460, partial [Chloroflexota bacterium]
VDDERFVHYTASGAVRGFEFLDASQGVNLLGLPVAGIDVAGELTRIGIEMTNPIRIVDHHSPRNGIPKVAAGRSITGHVTFAPRFIQLVGNSNVPMTVQSSSDLVNSPWAPHIPAFAR